MSSGFDDMAKLVAAEDSQEAKTVSPRKAKQKSFEDAIERVGFGTFQYKLCVLLGWTWMAEAMELMLMYFMLVEVQREWKLTRSGTATIGSFIFVGMLLGNWVWGMLADTYGRRNSLLGAVGTALVMGLVSSSATGPMSLALLRALTGFGIGGFAIAYSLFTEYLPTKNRGLTLLIVQGSAWTLGAFIQGIIAWCVVPAASWRAMLAASAIPLGLLLAAHWWYLPESARWYLATGRTAEAQFFIREVAIINGKPMGECQLADVVVSSRGAMATLLQDSLHSTTLHLWALWFANSFLYFGVAVFAEYYFRSEKTNVYIVAIVSALAEIPGLVLAGYLLDRKGASNTIAILLFGTGANVLFLSGMVTVPPSVLSIFTCCARGFLAGSISVTLVHTTQIYPTSCRGTGLGAAIAVGRVAAIATTYVALEFKPHTYIVPILFYTVIAGIGGWVALRLPSETNRPLSDAAEPDGSAVAQESQRLLNDEVTDPDDPAGDPNGESQVQEPTTATTVEPNPALDDGQSEDRS